MTLSINLTNSNHGKPFVKHDLTQETDKRTTDAKTSRSLSRVSTKTVDIAQTQIESSLGKETLLSLQELQESTANLLSSSKPEVVTLQKEPELDDTPRLSWLVGRDNDTYNWFKDRIPYSIEKMNAFRHIVESNKDSHFINHKDMITLQGYINGFQGGYDLQQKAKALTDDPIVHKVLDYTMPKTQARLQLIKDYLASKEPDPVEAAKIKEREESLNSLSDYIKTRGKSNLTLDIPFSKITHLIDFKSDDTTQKLLEFLTRDLRWYDWYLRDDDSETLESLPLTKISKLVEIAASAA